MTLKESIMESSLTNLYNEKLGMYKFIIEFEVALSKLDLDYQELDKVINAMYGTITKIEHKYAVKEEAIKEL